MGCAWIQIRATFNRRRCVSAIYCPLDADGIAALGVMEPPEGWWSPQSEESWILESLLRGELLTEHLPWTIKWVRNKLLLHLSHPIFGVYFFGQFRWFKKYISCQGIGVTIGWWVGRIRLVKRRQGLLRKLPTVALQEWRAQWRKIFQFLKSSQNLDYVKSLDLKSCNQAKNCFEDCAIQHCVGQIKHVCQLHIAHEHQFANLATVGQGYSFIKDCNRVGLCQSQISLLSLLPILEHPRLPSPHSSPLFRVFSQL